MTVATVVKDLPTIIKFATAIPKYWKAISAFLGSLATFLAAVEANAAITGVLPHPATIAIGSAGAVITGVVTAVKTNAPSNAQKSAASTAASAVQAIDEVTKVINEFKSQGSAASVVVNAASAIPVAGDVIKNVVTPVVGTTLDVVDQAISVFKHLHP